MNLPIIFSKDEMAMTNEVKSESLTPEAPQKQKRIDKNAEKPVRWYSLRLIPIWLRIILVILLIVVAGASGLMIGFSVIGGGNAADVLKFETWEHILNIVNGVE